MNDFDWRVYATDGISGFGAWGPTFEAAAKEAREKVWKATGTPFFVRVTVQRKPRRASTR